MGNTYSYSGDIPFGIWWLIVSLACIIIGILIPQLSVLIFIGGVLLLLLIGLIIIDVLQG